MSELRMGTRGSPLALAQAGMVAQALCAAHGLGADAVETVVIRTTGDRVQDRPLAEIGGKALWTKELDRALLTGEIDFAVHSMKDVETLRPAEIRIVAMLPRADVRDRLVGAPSVAALREGAVVGTSSPRRSAQLLHRRPDLRAVLFRGNVQTRLDKLAAGEADATLLAAAGLARLGRDDVGASIAVEDMLPAPAQGAIGIEARADDRRVGDLLGSISDAATFRAVMTERALLAALGGTCHTPVAALVEPHGTGQALRLRAEIYLPDGSERQVVDLSGEDGDALAREAARRLLDGASATLRATFSGG